MKLLLMLLICCSLGVGFEQPASVEAYMNVVNKVSALIHHISQKITSELINQPATRLGQSITTADYSKKMITEIENEIAKINENKNPDQLSQEEKDLIALLEMYSAQLEMCTSMAG